MASTAVASPAATPASRSSSRAPTTVRMTVPGELRLVLAHQLLGQAEQLRMHLDDVGSGHVPPSRSVSRVTVPQPTGRAAPAAMARQEGRARPRTRRPVCRED